VKRKRFSVEQIVGILKQVEVGVPMAEVIRKAGTAEQTFYRWKKQYVGLEVDQVQQLKQLQEENVRLKQLVAELSLDKTGRAGKKVLKPSRRGPAVEYLCDRYRVSERHACLVLRVPRATYRYRSCSDPRTELRMRIRELARTRVRYGYRRIRVLLNREGWMVGRYLVYRLYKEEGLTLSRRPARRKRTAAMTRQEKVSASKPNQVWSLDFVTDQLANGRRFRALTIVDIYTRESLAIKAAAGLKGADVVRVLNHLKGKRGVPQYLFCDNGSEFTGQAMDLWAHQNQVRIDFSRPGKPTDNALIESFNGTFRSECLSTHWFASLQEARHLIENWRREYNYGPYYSTSLCA
jgi:putative transposase